MMILSSVLDTPALAKFIRLQQLNGEPTVHRLPTLVADLVRRHCHDRWRSGSAGGQMETATIPIVFPRRGEVPSGTWLKLEAA